MEKQHSLLRSKWKQRRICLLQCSLLSWKNCAKSSSLNKVKPNSCFGLGKGCKAGNLTVLSFCFKNWRRVFKIAATSFNETDTSSQRMNLCWFFKLQNWKSLKAKVFCWNLCYLEQLDYRSGQCPKCYGKNNYQRRFRPKNFPQPLRKLFTICLNLEVASI